MRCRLVAALLLAVVVGGCGLIDPDDGGAAEDLARARALWSRADLEDYDLEMTRLCFCSGPAEVTVRVRGGQRVAVVPVTEGTGTPLGPEEAAWYPTVEELFGLVDEALREGVDELRVTYHPTLGHPVELWIDQSFAVADEEVGFRVELDPVGPGS